MIRSAFVIQSQIYPKAALVVGRGLADGGRGSFGTSHHGDGDGVGDLM